MATFLLKSVAVRVRCWDGRGLILAVSLSHGIPLTPLTTLSGGLLSYRSSIWELLGAIAKWGEAGNCGDCQ